MSEPEEASPLLHKMPSAPTMIYAGTDSSVILAIEWTPAGAMVLRQTVENAANPLKLKNGGPGGIATEWVELHPSRKRLYAVTSFWNTAEAQIVTYNVDPARPEASLEKLAMV